MKQYIHSIGVALPNRIVSNADLALHMDTTDEWIKTRTGIAQRYMVEEESHTSLATRASECAFATTSIPPHTITHIIGATCSPDTYSPSLAVSVAHNLGMTNICAFDMNAMCSGYLYGLEIARGLLCANQNSTILLLASELMSRRINMNDRTTAVLFGDASTATILSTQHEGALAELEDVICCADGTLSNCLTLGGACGKPKAVGDSITDDFFIQMNGREVFKNAVRIMPMICEQVLSANGYTIDDVDLLIAHQANFRIIEAVGERLGIAQNKVFINVHNYGNTSSATIPLALYEAKEQGILQQGMKVLLVAFGGGFTWGSALLQC